MADRRKPTGNSIQESSQETERQFMDKYNVNGMLKDVLTKLIANRPDDPIRFIANYFEAIALDDQPEDIVNRALQVLSLTHYSRPVFETNVISAFDILSKFKISKKLHGVNGVVHTQLLKALCKNMPPAVQVKLFKKIECSEHEAVPFTIFRSTIFTCCVLTDFISMAGNLFFTLDVQKTGNADKNLCTSTLDQLKTALSSSKKDVKRIMESSYNLGPDNLYKVLDKAMSKNASQSGLYNHDEFIMDACEIFLSKVSLFLKRAF
ncbi:unnamed protein product [Lymnaea stagnalis]|uniref:Tubulin polyglutamylase complex subunit 1-like C-terminal domain-containing protein n=1 Tax=Lymnaea stagnalis TaxID=6523 RepID=A0AAV2IQT3_LYMST